MYIYIYIYIYVYMSFHRKFHYKPCSIADMFFPNGNNWKCPKMIVALNHLYYIYIYTVYIYIQYIYTVYIYIYSIYIYIQYIYIRIYVYIHMFNSWHVFPEGNNWRCPKNDRTAQSYVYIYIFIIYI